MWKPKSVKLNLWGTPPPRTPKCAFSQSPVRYPLYHHHLPPHHRHKHHQHHPERACGGLGLASLAPSTSSIREAWEEAAGRNRDTSLVLRPLCIHQHQLSLQVMCLTPPLPNNPASTLHQSDKTKNKGIKNVTCQLPMSGQSGQMALGRWFSQMVTDTHCRVLSAPLSPGHPEDI